MTREKEQGTILSKSSKVGIDSSTSHLKPIHSLVVIEQRVRIEGSHLQSREIRDKNWQLQNKNRNKELRLTRIITLNNT